MKIPNTACYTFSCLKFILDLFPRHSATTLIAVFFVELAVIIAKNCTMRSFNNYFLYEVPLVDMPTVVIYSKALSHELSNVSSL